MKPPSVARLVFRNLAGYRWTNLAVALSAAVAAAAIVGALAVGDSIRHTLREIAALRLGDVRAVCAMRGEFFSAALADRLAAGDTTCAPVVHMDATATDSAETRRAGSVQLVGADARFFRLGPDGDPGHHPPADTIAVNRPLARRLGVATGDEILLTVPKPGLLPRDIPLAGRAGATETMRLAVHAVLGPRAFGRFSLRANHAASLTAVVDREYLCGRIGLPGKANIILAGPHPVPDGAVAAHWRPADAGLEIRATDGPGTLELVSGRVFIPPAAVRAAIEAYPRAEEVITYPADTIVAGEKTSYYPFVAAVAPGGLFGDVVTAGTGDDEMIVNRWLADDLDLSAGDRVTLKWFGLRDGTLEKFSADFRVAGITPVVGAAADRSLMPELAGISGTDDCSDWETGLPVDLDKVTDRDEDYWDRYRGTPKAFVTLAAGTRMWSNRFGACTAVRLNPAESLDPAAAERRLADHLDPAALGLSFRDVKADARAAAVEAMDFGMLFAGLSIFLIAAALLLTGLLFSLAMQQRRRQAGILAAMGFGRRLIGRIFLAEAAVIAAAGCAAGTAAGLLYTVLLLDLLSGTWSGAVAAFPVSFHVEPLSLAASFAGAFLASLGAMWFSLRRTTRRRPVELLAGGTVPVAVRRGRSRLLFLLAGTAAGAAAALVWKSPARGMAAAGVFFAAGGFLLAAALVLCYLSLRRSGRLSRRRPTFASLVMRGAGRLPGRGLVAAAVLAAGVFLTVSINVFRIDPGRSAAGTGGFALYAESALPVFADLNTRDGWEEFGLDPTLFDGVRVVSLRLREGDDASCRNLNRPRDPRVLGVRPSAVLGDDRFPVAAGSAAALSADGTADGPVPAAADEPTLTWALKKSVGDTLAVPAGSGGERALRFTAVLPSSILQGAVIVPERHFLELFPGVEGHAVFLVDCPPEKADAVAAALTRAGADVGMSVESATARLGRFAEIQNTYLTIFSVLGGIGLLLGGVGFGVVTARNIAERRGELATLLALGFRRRSVTALVAAEHLYLVLWGGGAGLAAAVIAVYPVLSGRAGPAAVVVPLGLAAAVVAACLLWTSLAARLAMRGRILDALRRE